MNEDKRSGKFNISKEEIEAKRIPIILNLCTTFMRTEINESLADYCIKHDGINYSTYFDVKTADIYISKKPRHMNDLLLVDMIELDWDNNEWNKDYKEMLKVMESLHIDLVVNELLDISIIEFRNQFKTLDDINKFLEKKKLTLKAFVKWCCIFLRWDWNDDGIKDFTKRYMDALESESRDEIEKRIHYSNAKIIKESLGEDYKLEGDNLC